MKKTAKRGKVKAPSDAAPELSRTEALLAQLLLQSMGSGGQQKKALALRAAGLSNVEVAQLMGTTAAVVAQVLYQARRDRVLLRLLAPPVGKSVRAQLGPGVGAVLSRTIRGADTAADKQVLEELRPTREFRGEEALK
jgi:hypothetical protein